MLFCNKKPNHLTDINTPMYIHVNLKLGVWKGEKIMKSTGIVRKLDEIGRAHV